MSSTRDISADEVRRLLAYDPFTGEFRWRVSPSNIIAAGSKAGYSHRGYVKIHIRYSSYRAHRLAWLHAYGVWPGATIDHVNGDKTDNRLHNLRDVTRSVNQQNIKGPLSHNTHGFLGVYHCHRLLSKPWAAQITLDRRSYHLGYYATGEEAHAAYLEAKRKMHPGNTL